MVIKNIKTFLKSSPYLYMFLLFSQTAGVIVIMFAYSVYMNNQYSLNALRYDGQRFEVSVVNMDGTGVLAEKMREAFPEILFGYDDILEYCYVASRIVPETTNSDGSWEGTITSNVYSRFSVTSGSYTAVDEFPEKYIDGRLFTEEDLNSGKYICIVSKRVYDEFGENVIIGSDKYEVVGKERDDLDFDNSIVNFGVFNIRVPIEVLPKAVNDVEITVFFNRVLTSKEYKDLGERFASAFGVDINDMTDGYKVELDIEKSLKTMMLAVVFMGLVSAYSSAKFYGYILEKRRKMTAVYLVCGAKKSKAASIYMQEVLLLQLITTVLGIIVYMKLMLPRLFEKYKFLALIFEDSSNCYKLVILYSVLVLVLSFLSIMINIYRTPIQTLKKNYGR